MSLLLEALKKAERAKQEAQRSAQEAIPEGSSAFSLAPSDETRHVVTRDELPDITRPVHIESADISAPAEAAPPRSDARPPTDPLASMRTRGEAEAIASGQSAARKVFEAKFREPNPKLPFYITVGVLAALTFGTGIYFWYQLRPPPPLVNPNPPRQANDPAPSAQVPATIVQPKVEDSPPAIPGLPQSGTTQPLQGNSVSTATNQLSSSAVPPTADPAPRAGQRAASTAVSAVAPDSAAVHNPSPAGRRNGRTEKNPGTQAQESLISIRTPPSIHPRVESGYAAFLRGDLVTARESYLQALSDDAHNRDALLGLAAIETSARHYELAENYYQRLLQADPRDANAIAGILALRSSVVDPVAAESRVKSMLAADPEATALNFSLGNQLALQGRWPEAQQAYFKAHVADPENPDLAYNLAVSLDHVRQVKLAVQYYRRALTLAEKRPVSFSVPAARARITDLEK